MGERRTVLVAVRISPAESADWRAMARTRTWTAPAAEVERERTRQVVRIGNNLNQIARWASMCQWASKTAHSGPAPAEGA